VFWVGVVHSCCVSMYVYFVLFLFVESTCRCVRLQVQNWWASYVAAWQQKKNENERTPGVHETMLAVAGTCGHVSTCSLFSGCASVILNMSVHVCLYCTVYKERWALNSFGDTRVPVCHCICSYPPPHAHAPPLLLSDPTFPLPSSSGHDYWGGPGTPSGLRVRGSDT